MTTPVHIVGAGWAGLAAAVSLAHRGIPVHVYEAARQPGGRARNVHSQGMDLDNGQHLMIGAYRQMLDLLALMGADVDSLFYRTPQQLHMLDYPSGLRLPRLPAPLHLLMGMLTSRPLSWGQKLHTLVRFNRLLNSPIDTDTSVSDWLDTAALPTTYVDNVLKPLCLAALTTRPEQASARVFQSVLIQTFNGARANTDLLIARKNLGDVFPEQARRFIESRGGRVFCQHKVEQLICENDRISAIQLPHGRIPVEQLLLATPAAASARLLSSVENCDTLVNRLQQLSFEPITTVYLQYPEHLRLPCPMTGVVNATAEWLFDRRICDQPGLIAAVISGSGPHDRMDRDDLINRVAGELQHLFDWPAPQTARVIREKRACFRCTPDIDRIRPGPQTPISNLHLCGDYVYIEETDQPGLPSTLEGALRSGVKCATQLIKECN